MSVPDVAGLVSAAAAEAGERLAVVEAGGRAVTWSELDAEVSRVASGLAAAGIVAGHRVLLALGNRLEFVTTYLGVLRAQAVAVPVNPGSTPDELARMLADSGARMVLADPDTAAAVRGALATLGAGDDRSIRTVVVATAPEGDERTYDDLVAAEPRETPALQDPEKLAVLLYTSGTSGLPRAVMLTHRALLANLEQVAAVEPPMIHSDDVVLGVLPLFHVYGLNAVLGGVVRHRAKLVLAERFDPEGTLDLIEDEACSVVPVAPPVFAHWRGVEALEERLGPVRLVLSGSAPLAAEVIDEFTARTGVPVHQGYGLTEAAPVVTTTLGSDRHRPGSVGAALDGIDLRLVDDDRAPLSGADLSDPGEIEIRGANLFSGYWPDGADGPDADGWWPTGDVGVFDDAGHLHLVDRVKDLVIVSGFNVYPTEVEAVVREVPGVRQVAVIGAEDELTGEAVVAFVVPTDPTADPAALAAAVEAHCDERLARFKRPTRLDVVAELPHTVTGKVQKGRLRGRERRRALGLIE
ncbi:class I adenylate-forming enzyme family protein [Nocardioides stalactiti]|uniref:class I adenylate-forming enzyme family protein n=1 Tax=Nocardioides stalactiti TaxID=2755356 RepID=UPI0016010041|nr:AMP-binding protein [Nocardioides stalactiti]